MMSKNTEELSFDPTGSDKLLLEDRWPLGVSELPSCLPLLWSGCSVLSRLPKTRSPSLVVLSSAAFVLFRRYLRARPSEATDAVSSGVSGAITAESTSAHTGTLNARWTCLKEQVTASLCTWLKTKKLNPLLPHYTWQFQWRSVQKNQN